MRDHPILRCWLKPWAKTTFLAGAQQVVSTAGLPGSSWLKLCCRIQAGCPCVSCVCGTQLPSCSFVTNCCCCCCRGGYFEKTRMCRLSGFLGRINGTDGRSMCL